MRKLFLIGVLVGLLSWLTAPAGAAAAPERAGDG